MASSTVTFVDVVMFLITIASIYGGVLAMGWAQNWLSGVASSVKSSLEQKGVHVCSRGVSVKVPQYYDQEEYVNLHRR
ncbi:hypothetical protein D9619_009048 [Psilocybe cf. subviscida]|uniref:Uncharacterized protein n=1 Tax=Psilocybe cf. subviscida TaxID=2480587 RepID=A0A8H5FA93_9AGAR|nr:hypothetical protein D9619_009048 [Psilocybe cf. subviscida]